MFKIVLIFSLVTGGTDGGAFGSVTELSPRYETINECLANAKRLQIRDIGSGLKDPDGEVKTYPVCIKD